jgi:hypothetical protein
MSTASINTPEDLSQGYNILAEMFGTEAISSVVQPEVQDAEITTSVATETVQESVEPATEPAQEPVVNEEAPQSQTETEESKPAVIDRVDRIQEDLRPNLVDSINADSPPPKPFESLAEALSTHETLDWTERPFEWERWATLPTSKPSTERFTQQTTDNVGKDRRDHALKVWDREVSRTYYFKEKFWYLNDTGRWYGYPKTDLINILEGTDLFRNRPHGRDRASWQKEKTNAFIRRVQTKNAADFVGKLPGYPQGLHTFKNQTFLIIAGPELIDPVEGSYEPVVELLEEVLGKEETIYLKGWLKTADRCLRDGDMSSGQMLIIGGKKDSGKTFIKEHIIRLILGGRHADPSEYLKGGRFNEDVFEAESWEIDDGVGTKEKRQVLTGALKKVSATSEFRIEGKFAKGIQSPPVLARVHSYVNTDNESELFAVPEIADSVRDKLIVLHAKQSKHERPSTVLPDRNVEGAREAFVKKIRVALPAFIHHLQNWEIPEKYRSARYGVAPYISPELEKVFHNASDEGKLAALIDRLIFTHLELTEAWEGTEEELENQLAAAARDTNQTQDLNKVKWKSGAIGEGVARLARVQSDRYSKRPRTGKSRGWIIQPPEGHAAYMAEKKEARKGKPSVSYPN